MYRKQVRRRRAVLALLIIGSFLLLTVTYGQSSGGVQQGTVSTIFSPLQSGRRPGAEAGPRPGRLVRRDLRRAGREQPAALPNCQTRANRPSPARRRCRRTRSCASWSELDRGPVLAISAYEPVTGRVIARSPTVWHSAVTIDLGRDDGVQRRRPGDQRRRPRRARRLGAGRLLPGDAAHRPHQRRLGQGPPGRRPGRDQARTSATRRTWSSTSSTRPARSAPARRSSPPAGAPRASPRCSRPACRSAR